MEMSFLNYGEYTGTCDLCNVTKLNTQSSHLKLPVVIPTLYHNREMCHVYLVSLVGE